MRSDNLAKLETLSEDQADQSRKNAESQREELHLLDRQHSSLKHINDEYQTSIIGSGTVAPTMLAHRRAFVTQLSGKLDVMKAECLRQGEVLQEKMELHQQHAAQTAAIGSMVDDQRELEKQIDTQREQRQQDDAQFALRQFQKTAMDNDHE